MSSPVRIVVFGAGLIGRRHAAHVHTEPQAILTAIVEPFAGGDEFAQSYAVPCFRSIDSLLTAAVDFDAAILGSPTNTHADLAIRLLALNKHVLIEKPIAADIKSARQVLEAAQTSKGRVLVGHHRRFNPYVVSLKAAIDAGKLGTLLGVTGVWTALKPDSYFGAAWRQSSSTGGGVMAINLIHDVDLMQYFFGKIERVYVEEGRRMRDFDAEETAAATIRFANGAVGTFFLSDATPSPLSFEGATGENPDLIGYYGKNIYTLFGSRSVMQFPSSRRYSFDGLSPNEEKGWLHRLGISDDAPGVDKSIPPFTLQLRHFVKVCMGKEKPRCTGEDAFNALAVVQAMQESLQGGVPVSIP